MRVISGCGPSILPASLQSLEQPNDPKQPDEVGLGPTDGAPKRPAVTPSGLFGLLKPLVAATIWGSVFLFPAYPQAQSGMVSAPAETPAPLVVPRRAEVGLKAPLQAQPALAQSNATACGLTSMAMIINGVAVPNSRPVSERQVRDEAIKFEVFDAVTQRAVGPAYGDRESGGPQGLLADAAPAVLQSFGVESFLESAPRVLEKRTDLMGRPRSEWGGYIPITAEHIRSFTGHGSRPAMFAFRGISDPINTVHFVVVDGLDASDNVLVRNPNGGRRERLTLTEFNKKIRPGHPIVVVGSPPAGYNPYYVARPR